MFANIHTKIRVDSLLREQIFRLRSDIREVNSVVQLVQKGGSVGSFRSTGFASIFFPSRFGLRWCSVDQRLESLDFGEWHAGWLFEPGAAVDGHRFSSNWQWTWFCVCGLEEQRTDTSSSMREQSEKREVRKSSTATEHETTPKSWSHTVQTTRLPDRPVKTSHTTCRHCHDQQSDRTETSIFCLQNDATVRRTVTTFVCPHTQFHENLHTNFALQNLPIEFRWSKPDEAHSEMSKTETRTTAFTSEAPKSHADDGLAAAGCPSLTQTIIVHMVYCPWQPRFRYNF